MTVKFKIGFTIAGETLFAMIAKMLPIENLSVEELGPASKTPLADRAIAHHQKRFPTQRKKMSRASPGPTLNRGINGIIVTELKAKPCSAAELKPKMKAAGYSPDSLSSRLERLLSHGVIERAGAGLWRLKPGAA